MISAIRVVSPFASQPATNAVATARTQMKMVRRSMPLVCRDSCACSTTGNIDGATGSPSVVDARSSSWSGTGVGFLFEKERDAAGVDAKSADEGPQTFRQSAPIGGG